MAIAMPQTITSREELLALIEQAGHGPAEQAASAVTARQLIADLPTLPPLRMPGLTPKAVNGARVREVLAAGPRAALVHTRTGVRVVPDIAAIADDPDVVVLTQHAEVSALAAAKGATDLTVAHLILDRELTAADKAAA